MSVGAVQEQFPPDVTRPLAQLIVLDAAHGDSNVIDLCTQTIAPNGRYLERSWERYLIDTGPPHAQVASNVVRVLETYKQPKNHKGNAPPSEPRVNMVQFTHTDEDHSGGGAKFLQTLATNKNLQKRFEKTQLLFHKLPIQDPGWTLVLKNTVQNQAYPFTVSCFSQAWHDYAVNFGSGAANIMVRYTFTLDNTPSTTSDSPDLLIDKKHIKNKKTITVTCVVTLLGRRHVGRTNQLVEFQMRKYHKDMFTVKKSFLGSIQQTGPSLIPQTDPVVKRKKLADFKDKKDPRYDAVTRQLVPDYERRRADQTYHDIEGALPALREIDDERSMSRQQRQRLPPLLQWPVVSPKQGDSYSENNLSLASVDFVGPTKTIYQDFIGDCMRVEYDQGVVDEDPGDPALDALGKESELHNMASIVTLFRRYSTVAARVQRGTPLFSMLYTGDAHDRECQIRDTVLGFAGSVPARLVDVLKIPHHGSLCSTSVEFYNRITARVYLICAKQNNHGLPNLRILEAMVSHTAEGHGPTAHLFFSNPDSLWNLKSNSSPSGVQSNLNILLTGPHRPGANGPGTFNYKCYIMKHRKSPWNWKSNSLEKNAGIILLGHNNNGELVITAPEKYWDIWDAARVQKLNTTGGDSLRSYWQLR